MSKQIYFQLFGNPLIFFDGEPVTFSFAKVNALLYYLAVNKIVSRDEIAGLLWPEKTEKSAKKNLRNTIYQANKVLGEDCIEALNNKVLVLNDKLDIKTDVDIFLSGDIAGLDIYTDIFLKGFYIKDAEEFDLWISKMRQHYEQKFIREKYQQIEHLMMNKQYEHVENFIYKLIEMDEFDERHYQLLMKFYQETDRDSKVVEVYHQLANLLETELGITPSLETRQLYEDTMQFVNRKKKIKQSNQQVAFVSRHQEVSEIEYALTKLSEKNRRKHLLLTGEAGVGKSYLCQRLLNHYQKDCERIEIDCYQSQRYASFYVIKQLWDDLTPYILTQGVCTEETLSQKRNDFFERTDDLSDERLEQLIDFLSFVIKQISQKQAFVFYIDDTHWMDVKSLSVFIALLIQLKKVGSVLFVLTAQSLTDDAFSRKMAPMVFQQMIHLLPIQRFTKEEVATFVEKQVVSIDVTEQLIDQLYTLTEGVPFYLAEYTELLKKDMALDKMTSRMQEFIKYQLSDLSEEQMDLLIVLSYFRKQVRYDILLPVVEQSDANFSDNIQLLKELSLIKEIKDSTEIWLDFSHYQLKNYLYTKQTYTKKRLFHKKIATILQQVYAKGQETYLLQEIAHHFNQAKEKLEALRYEIDYLQSYLKLQYDPFPIAYPTDNKKLKEKEQYALSNELEIIEQSLLTQEKDNQQSLLYQMLLVKFFLLKGRFLIRCGQYKQGIHYLEKVIDKAQEVNNSDYLFEAYRQMIYYFIQVDKPREMILYVKKAMDVSLEVNNYEQMGVLLRLEGVYYLMIGDLENAERLFNESVHIFSITPTISAKYRSNIAAAYDYLAEINRQRRKYLAALSYHKKALDLCENSEMYSSQIIFYIDQGITLYAQKQYKQALESFLNAQMLLPHVSTLWKKMQLDVYIALSYIKQGELVKAKASADQEIMETYPDRDQGLLYYMKAALAYSDEKAVDGAFTMYCHKAKEKLNPYRDRHILRDLEKMSKRLKNDNK